MHARIRQSIRKISELKSSLTQIYGKQINEIVARYEFHHLCQRPYQSVREYVREMESKIAECQYASFADTMIRDQLVFGVSNEKENICCQNMI